MRTARHADLMIECRRQKKMTDSRRTLRVPDPYQRCEEGCTHDLAAGLLIEDLLSGDGPFSPLWEPQPAGGGFLLWAHRRAQGDESAA
jgi:hypothetical protein